MNVVEFTHRNLRFLVVPENVVYLQDFKNYTVLHLTGGQTVSVDGNADEVAHKLQGRG